MKQEIMQASGCKLVGVLGSGCQSVAYKAVDETGKERCLKMALINNERYYARSILESAAGTRKFDLPIERSGTLDVDGKTVEWMITDIAKPNITPAEHDYIEDQLVENNMIYVDPSPSQWGKVDGEIVLLDFNAVVAIDELPDDLQRFCMYIKRNARKFDFDSENAAEWRTEMYHNCELFGYDKELTLTVNCWIRTRRLYANY